MPKTKPPKDAAPSAAKTGDARFSNFESDPRFRLPSKKATKTKIDSRFSRMLKDEEFTRSTKVDRYGRKLKSDSKKKALKNLYEAEGTDSEAEDEGIVKNDLQKVNANYDPARGGGFESDSDEEDEEDEGEEDSRAEVKPAASMQKLRDEEAEVETGEVSRRIAIVNLDWDNIQSADLMALFSSFTPKGGRIERISIYPSEFGKERMAREEIEGPPREIFKKGDGNGDDAKEDLSNGDDDDDANIITEGDDQDFDSNALRSYQLDRLRYYYAVMVCSDKATAEKIYEETDGSEYSTSSNFLDLRFIPDDVTFDDAARDECDTVPLAYRPTEFVTDALQHSKVKLTWDTHPEDASRKEDIKRAFSGSRAELQENDLRAYLASESEGDAEFLDEDEAAEDQPKLSKKDLARQKMREALGLGAESSTRSSKPVAVGEVELTFTPGDEDTNKSKHKSGDVQETTVEKYMRKEREKKALRKEKVVAKRDGVDVTEADDADVAEDGDDLGFDDPFFTMDEPVKAPKSNQRKEERLKKRELKQAEAAESAAQRVQLQQLMADDSKETTDHLDHFDMNEIARLEKQKSKIGKKKRKQKDAETRETRGGLQDGFQMNVEDDRFKAVFESHEFAIDPTNPKFKATPGMKQLLEEGRKKRGNETDDTSSRSKKSRRR